MRATEGLVHALLRNPITGIAGCCASATIGHAAAAPLRSVMNVRRLISNMGDCLPLCAINQRRELSAMAERHGWNPKYELWRHPR
jgi:hypothetical protein